MTSIARLGTWAVLGAAALILVTPADASAQVERATVRIDGMT